MAEDEVIQETQSEVLEDQEDVIEPEEAPVKDDRELEAITRDFVRHRQQSMVEQLEHGEKFSTREDMYASTTLKEKRISIPIRFSPTLYKQFKIALIQDGTTAQKVIERMVQDYVYDVAKRVPPITIPEPAVVTGEHGQADYSAFRSRNLD